MKQLFVSLFVIGAALILIHGCSSLNFPHKPAKDSVPESARKEEVLAPTIPPPSLERIVLLPTPRMLRLTPNAFAPDTLVPQETLRPEMMPHQQGYILSVEREQITLIAAAADGLFYAHQTLNQLKNQYKGSGVLPVVYIEDWPDFPNRGVMLDIARDKIPTMESLYQMVDLFASLKLNQLQLYMEHSFAYPGHEVVWKDASPMTGDEIRALDQYCKERFISLVPNQNSFGHMHRWLKHDAYKHLAESPSSTDLCPVHPGSIALLRSMYAALLPNFSSTSFNVGCDETYGLGKGCSKDAVNKLGKGRVYLNFLKEIHGLVEEQGRTMQFWADIILNYPSLIPELPDNVVAMVWGYEADHPFADRCRKLAASGVPFYVCPGTSSWNSLLGRTNNALENLKQAARNGLNNHAIGFLMTDWGDNGHWQGASISFVPFAWGAALSWAYDANVELDLAHAANVHVFQDSSELMAQAAMDLGNAHLATGSIHDNNTVYYGLLLSARDNAPGKNWIRNMSIPGIQTARYLLEDASSRMEQAQPTCPNAGEFLNEFFLNIRMAKFALRLGEERLKGDCGTALLPLSVRQSLLDELTPIISEFKTVWLARNRVGGLADSVGRLESLAALLAP
ncbi:MAG: family 20 glycosylhydrolase [Candidatus Hydrogenedentales bacterium]